MRARTEIFRGDHNGPRYFHPLPRHVCRVPQIDDGDRLAGFDQRQHLLRRDPVNPHLAEKAPPLEILKGKVKRDK